LLIFGTNTLGQLKDREFDVLINLEKDIGICTFLNQINAKKKYGFYFNDTIHNIATRRKYTQYLLAGQENHKSIKKNALEILYETVGEVWRGQGLILGCKPVKNERYDIGFNYAVGSKWPTKAWPEDHWKSLENLLGKSYKITWQQGHKSLSKYIDWINNCRVIVTSDSLGQAIAQALGKKVVTLYGPTNYVRMQGIPEVTVLPSTLKCPHMPCFLPVCKFDKFCMDYISPERVAQICKAVLSNKK
jgi:heptosyltransferase-2